MPLICRLLFWQENVPQNKTHKFSKILVQKLVFLLLSVTFISCIASLLFSVTQISKYRVNLAIVLFVVIKFHEFRGTASRRKFFRIVTSIRFFLRPLVTRPGCGASKPRPRTSHGRPQSGWDRHWSFRQPGRSRNRSASGGYHQSWKIERTKLEFKAM